jgi:hypothetical protein
VRLRILPPLAEQERTMEFLMNPGSAQVVTFRVAEGSGASVASGLWTSSK